MRRLGIYLAYSKGIELSTEGLGRLMAEFLRAAQQQQDIRFVIACPRWMEASLNKLFAEREILSDSFEFLIPQRRTLGIIACDFWLSIINLNWSKCCVVFFRQIGSFPKAVRYVVLLTTAILVLPVIPLIVLAMSFHLVFQKKRRLLDDMFVKLKSIIKRIPVLHAISLTLLKKLTLTDQNSLKKNRENSEQLLMLELINARNDIHAWFSPTAFWPLFNKINAPRLMCIPDVVLCDFPIPFAIIGGDAFLQKFRDIKEAILGGQYFLTYSETVKVRTLVSRFQRKQEAVFVVPHGANRLDDILPSCKTFDGVVTHMGHFKSALLKIVNHNNPSMFNHSKLKFIFYASQFRPHKNVITLLRAYNYLLKRRFVGYKLVLTGNPNDLIEIRDFIVDSNLENDVLCLHGLTTQELAACYGLADLAVTPSFSEGGFPFTFTEAISMGTPVVMARIAVTDEVIAESELRSAMLFDPYDWRDMAHRIEWALENKDSLFLQQKAFYDETLCRRDWRTVVGEYIDILVRISSGPKATAESEKILECATD